MRDLGDESERIGHGSQPSTIVILSEAKDPLSSRSPEKRILRFARDDNSIFSPLYILFIRALVIDNPLGVQLLDEADRVGANFSRRRKDELLLEFLHDLR